MVINTVHNIGNIIPGGCRQQHLGCPRPQMAAETGIVFPHTCIIHNQRIVDTVFSVINFLRTIGVDHLDWVAIDHQCIAFAQHPNGSFKGAMNRVPSQQRRALLQIIVQLAFANHYSPQPQHIAATSFINQNSRHQATDTSKTIEHHILRLGQRFNIGADNIGQLVTDKFFQRTAIATLLKLNHHLTQIQMGRTQLKPGNSIQHWRSIKLGEFIHFHLTHEAVSFHQVGDRLIDHIVAIHIGADIMLAIQLADNRNHTLG